jgi:peptidoglycan/xylan/chitin deacetylase (PgdA/CDA1 family)
MKPTPVRVRSALLGTAALVLLSAAAVLASPHASASAATTCPSASYGIHRYAPGSGKTVALTFDDGPGRSTSAITQILARARVEATFFNIGTQETDQPGRVRAEHLAGFALGGHTWDHKDLTTLDRAGQVREIDRERTEQASLVGAYPCLLRPPYGNYNATTLDIAQRRGMTVWNWSVDPEDWKAAGSDDQWWVARIIERAEAGGTMRHPVIILHNMTGGNPATVDALPTVIRYYKSHGYRFVDLYGHTGIPTVGRVSPKTGPAAGGTRVTITGHGFLGVRAVHFGSYDGTAIKVASDTSLTVTSPAHPPAQVHVRVITTFGTSPIADSDRFQYVAP